VNGAIYTLFIQTSYCWQINRRRLRGNSTFLLPFFNNVELYEAYLLSVSLAPFVPSRPDVVRVMLTVSHIGSDDVVFDLGCGDGRILLSAVKDFGAKKAVGYEIRNDLYKQLSEEIVKQGLQNRIALVNDDLMNADISEATVITLYLTPSGNDLLKPKLSTEAVKGTRIVSHDYEFSGWYTSVKKNLQGHMIYLYIVPEAFLKA